MRLCELVAEIERFQPEADPSTVARMAMLLALSNANLDELHNRDEFERQYHEIENRIRASMDQHAAVAEELDTLASSDPCEFSPDHLWTLIRAIKVQSQILSLYLDGIPVTNPK
jgi:hypothetical protein